MANQRVVVGVYIALSSFLVIYLISSNSSYRATTSKLEVKVRELKQELVGKIPPHNVAKDGQMLISVPMRLKLDTEGYIVFPKGVERVWFDVGAHRDAMYSLYKVQEQRDLAVIAFEPLYDMWSELTVKNHHERLFAFPVAVSEQDEGFTVFNRAGTDMCSSLKKPDPKTNPKDWPKGCATTDYEQPVTVVKLESFIRRIRTPFVEFLKIDAQGADFEVLLSCGDLIKRVATVVVEVQLKALYEGSKAHDDYIDHMESKGFVLVKQMLQARYEENLLFHNTLAPKLSDEQYSEILPLTKIFDGSYLRRRETKEPGFIEKYEEEIANKEAARKSRKAMKAD